MTNWKKVKLGDVADVKGGKRLPKGEELTAQRTIHPYIRVTDMGSRYIDKNQLLYVSESTFKSISRYIVNTDDIIVSIVGTIGAVAKIDRQLDNASLTENCVKFHLKNKYEIDSDFLYYFLISDTGQNEIAIKTVGSTQPKLPIYNIKDINISLPDYPTQTRIASILSALDDKIELNRQMNHTLEQMAQALFKKYFVDDIDPENLPEGWEIKKLGDMVTTKGGTTPSTVKQEYWDGNINWTSPKDLSSLSFPVLLRTEKKITDKGLSKISSGLLPIGTLLLSSRAPIGYLAITQIPVAINQGYIAIICDKGVSNHFMLYWLKSNMDTIERNANGSTFMEISKSSFRNIDITVPPTKILYEFEKIVSVLFKQIVNNEIQTNGLINIRNAILPKLMSGEIEIKEAETMLA